ncbi:DNA repair protein Swi5/Sae3 [Thermoascus aurantiacus ATCC 26904]
MAPPESADDHDACSNNSSTTPGDTSATPPAGNDDRKDDPPPDLSPAQLAQRQRKIYMQNALRASIADLESQIAQTESQLAETRSKLKSPDAAATVRRHIRLLHVYNEIKDVGQGLMGLIAEARGVRQVDVETEFGVGAGD